MGKGLDERLGENIRRRLSIRLTDWLGERLNKDLSGKVWKRLYER